MKLETDKINQEIEVILIKLIEITTKEMKIMIKNQIDIKDQEVEIIVTKNSIFQE